jgi:DNA-binding transcriptional regulator YiaG
LAVERPALPIPVTGRAGEDGVSVITSVEIKTLKPAQPEILRWFATRGKLGELERKHKVVFQPPDVEAIRLELRQMLEKERPQTSPPVTTANLEATVPPEAPASERAGRKPGTVSIDGEKLKQLRKDKHLSREGVARMSRKKFSVDTLSRIERGKPVHSDSSKAVIKFCIRQCWIREEAELKKN